MSKAQELYEKAKRIIPGGTQLLSKRPEMFLPGTGVFDNLGAKNSVSVR